MRNAVPSAPRRYLRYPLPNPPRPALIDRLATRAGIWPFRCTVCGRVALSRRIGPDSTELRETCACWACGATNRNRQVAYLASRVVGAASGARYPSLRHVARAAPDCAIYNTEARGAIHEALKGTPSYVASEYLEGDIAAGAVVDGVRHEDLMALTFADDHFDLVLSSDVLEHVPDPYKAHAEIYRVLKPGGRHVFTVPFLQGDYRDQRRAELGASGDVVFLEEPQYHEDPLRPESGALVFTLFSLEMLVRLRDIGFVTFLYQLKSPSHGVLGPNAVAFEAVKAANGR